MRALKLTSADGLDGVVLDTVPDVVPGAGEVRVALKAAALNHRELWIARGQYPGMVLPTTMGADGAGVIDAVGAGVDPRRIGEAVVLYPGLHWGDDDRFPGAAFGLLGMPGPGTLADAICVAAEAAVAKPEHLDFAQAASLPLAGLTAWRGLITKGALTAGETLLVTGVGGGVATFALRFGVAMGAEVVVTSGSAETLDKARALGAKVGVNYHEDKWGRTLGKLGGGIDVVFDGAPMGGYPQYGRALAMGARVVIYGSTGGVAFQANAPELFLKNVTLVGTNVGNPIEFKTMLDFVAEHRIEPVIDRCFTLDQGVEALRYLEGAHGFGKVVVKIAA